MPTYVRATKYNEAHYSRQVTEYRIHLFGETEDDTVIDHCDDKNEAIEMAQQHITDTGFPAVVERLVWTERSLDGVTGWEDYDRWGPKETIVFGEFPD